MIDLIDLCAISPCFLGIRTRRPRGYFTTLHHLSVTDWKHINVLWIDPSPSYLYSDKQPGISYSDIAINKNRLLYGHAATMAAVLPFLPGNPCNAALGHDEHYAVTGSHAISHVWMYHTKRPGVCGTHVTWHSLCLCDAAEDFWRYQRSHRRNIFLCIESNVTREGTEGRRYM